MTNPKIRYFGDLTPGTGHHNALRGYVQAFRHLGYTGDSLRVVGVSGGVSDELETNWLRQHVFGPWNGEDKINIVHVHPLMSGDYHTSVGERYNIAICAWETSVLPKEVHGIGGRVRRVVDSLNTFDEIWVPSSWLQGTFKESGVTAPIFVIPHALQEEVVLAATEFVEKRPEKMILYTIGSWNPRKNVEGALRAYLASGLKPTDMTQLLIHCLPSGRSMDEVIQHSYVAQEMAKNISKAAQSMEGGSPSFGVLSSPRSFDRILELHRQGDIYVSASRGEAFGLGAIEAAAFGNIVVGAGPWMIDQINDVDERCDVDISKLFRVGPYRSVPITPMPEAPGYLLDHSWFDPDHQWLSGAIKGAVEDLRSGRVSMGERIEMSKAIIAAYSPKAISVLIAERMKHATEVISRSGW